MPLADFTPVSAAVPNPIAQTPADSPKNSDHTKKNDRSYCKTRTVVLLLITMADQTPESRPPSRGDDTRREILEVAVDLASSDGLEGLSIGGLAEQLGMSKSGVFAHFGSKEGLQLAAVDHAGRMFTDDVVDGLDRIDGGLERLAAMLERWAAHIESGAFGGGCFFAAASAEFDDRHGRVRDRLRKLTASWLEAIADELAEARKLGQLDADSDGDQMAFELHAFIQEANWSFQLHDDRRAFERARRAIATRLGSAATADGRALLDRHWRASKP